jgi:adenylate cyclase
VSAVDVLSGHAKPDAFKDKIVFVGTTALGMRGGVDAARHVVRGRRVQATVADNLLQQDFIRRPDYGVMVETQIALVLGLVVALVFGRAVSPGCRWRGRQHRCGGPPPSR